MVSDGTKGRGVGKIKKRLPAVCSVCGDEFMALKHQVVKGKGKTCSLSCAASLAAKNRDQSGKLNPNWKGGDCDVDLGAGRKNKAAYRARHRDRHLAHKAVQDAVARGKMLRMPCQVCGDKRSHAHHEDYSKRLEVEWLCQKHHAERHRR